MTDSALIPSPTAGEEVRSYIEQAALRARVQSEAEDRLRFERLVADLAARFVNIPPEKLDEAIVDSQHQIVGVLDLDRSAFGAKATVVVPLVADGKLVGAVTFAAMRAERTWPMPVLDRLRLVGNVFAQALARRRSHEELQTVQRQWKVRNCVEREDRQEANRWRRVT